MYLLAFVGFASRLYYLVGLTISFDINKMSLIGNKDANSFLYSLYKNWWQIPKDAK